ncbi:MAG: hypothetical protein R2724_00850 [Bryobacterales bacterium]
MLPAPILASAQTAATIVGDVTDQAAAVPGVAITVTNEGTGAKPWSRQTKRGQSARYSSQPRQLPRERGGRRLQDRVRNDVVLQVSAVLAVDFTLELGEVTETIEVTGAAPIMQPRRLRSARSSTRRSCTVSPVNQRNYTRLILLMAGTSSVRRSQSRGTAESGTQLSP